MELASLCELPTPDFMTIPVMKSVGLQSLQCSVACLCLMSMPNTKTARSVTVDSGEVSSYLCSKHQTVFKYIKVPF